MGFLDIEVRMNKISYYYSKTRNWREEGPGGGIKAAASTCVSLKLNAV